MLLLLLLLLCGNGRVSTSACPVPMPSTELILDNAHKTNRNATSVSPPKKQFAKQKTPLQKSPRPPRPTAACCGFANRRQFPAVHTVRAIVAVSRLLLAVRLRRVHQLG